MRSSALVLSACFCGFLSSTLFAGLPGQDLLKAPPAFTAGTRTAIPVDFQFIEMKLVFEPASSKVTGVSKIEFYSMQEGYPFFDFVGTVTRATLNGVDIGAAAIENVSPPGGGTTFRLLNKKVDALSMNILELEFKPSSSTYSFSGGGARMVWAMSDVGADRNFMEKYVPSNLEFDAFGMRMNVEVKGSSSTHRVFTNGKLDNLGTNHWEILFPNYFTTSSFYFHVTNADLAVQESTYQGIEATIPIVTYSSSSSSASTAMSRTKSILAELEATYGAFAHERVVVYIGGSGGGMEHCGATISDLGALGHELTHSWFARGVMPSSGNSGWMDEAIASWRDNGYPRKSLTLTGSAANLAGFSPYRRTTTGDAYTYGASFIASLDGHVPGGMKKVLREVFSQKRRETLTTPMFESLLEQITGLDLTPYFKRYAYNSSRSAYESRSTLPPKGSKHPRAFTQAEIEALR